MMDNRVGPLLSIPHPGNFRSPHLSLKHEDAIHQRFGRRRTARNENVHGDDAVNSSDHRITVVIVPATVCTTAHTDNPSRLRHLVVALPDGRGHFVCDGSSHDHHISLSRRRAKDDTQSILIISRHRNMHHLDTAARETEGQGPKGALSGPVDNRIERRSAPLQSVDGQ